MSRSSPVGPNGGSDFLRFSSMLKPEIKLKRVQDIFKNILALGFTKVNGKNRKIQFFGTTLKYKLATLPVVVYFTCNSNFRFEFSIKVETLHLLKEFL